MKWHAPIGFNDSVKGYIVTDETGKVVALIPENGMENVPQNCQNANEAFRTARLVERAPELLNACQQALRTIEELCKNNDDPLASTAGLIRPLLRQVISGLR